MVLSGCTTELVDGNAVAATDLGHVAAPVTVAALQSLLPSPEQLDTALGVQGLAVRASSTRGYGGQTASDDCAATWNVAWQPMYTGSGWVAMRAQDLQTRDREQRVWQAVASFPLPVDAVAFYRKQVNAWQVCNGRRIEMRYLTEPASADAFFTLAPAADHDGVLSQTATQANDPTWMCEHALSAANNVVVDMQVCGAHLTGQAESVTRAVVAKVPVS